VTGRISIFKLKPRAVGGDTAPVAQGSLRLHELKSRIFRNTRMLRVWLPPQYDGRGETRYPVLYLNDGQNLFDPSTAFARVHWQAGETAGRLVREKKIPRLIIVGIDNAGRNRLREYIPYLSADPRVIEPQGKRYPKFLQREVMPLVEANYSVAKGPENTGLGGSSLGGLMALYTQLAAPGVFGHLLIESPSLHVANGRILEECRGFRDWPFRVYLGTGTRELGDPAKDTRIVEDVRVLEALLRAAGLDGRRLKVEIEEGATHAESAWAKRFPAALEFLFGGLAYLRAGAR
jgi:predicted alpha/beta superfamily hydrolase